jgi:hypothetical protein
MTTERDPRARIVLSWLREDAHENAERVLLRALYEVNTTPQRRPWWRAWRDASMNKLALAGAAAVVLVVAAVGYNLITRPAAIGPGATPSASPPLFARGNFVPARDWGQVMLQTTGVAPNVTGRMTMTRGDSSFATDIQCARTTADGFVLIGGFVSPGSGGTIWPDGTLVALVLKHGSPVQGQIWVKSLEPMSRATTCLDFLDEQLASHEARFPDQSRWLDPIQGTVEFGQ